MRAASNAYDRVPVDDDDDEDDEDASVTVRELFEITTEPGSKASLRSVEVKGGRVRTTTRMPQEDPLLPWPLPLPLPRLSCAGMIANLAGVVVDDDEEAAAGNGTKRITLKAHGEVSW